MSTLLIDLVRQLKLAGAFTKCVLVMLCYYVDDRHHRNQRRLLPKMPVAVNYETLAFDLGASERTVRRALDELVEAGWVSRGRRATDQRRKDYLIEVDTIFAKTPKPSPAAIAARLSAISADGSGQIDRDLLDKLTSISAKLSTIGPPHLDLDLSGSSEDLPGGKIGPRLRPHTRCDERTRRACDVGVCVPLLIIERWQGQCRAFGHDDAVIAELMDRVVEFTLNPAPKLARFIDRYSRATGTERFDLWNQAWAEWAVTVGGLANSLKLVDDARRVQA